MCDLDRQLEHTFARASCWDQIPVATTVIGESLSDVLDRSRLSAPTVATDTVAKSRPVAGSCDALLASMLRLAAADLRRHARSGSLCALCRTSWPCARACQADLLLAGW